MIESLIWVVPLVVAGLGLWRPRAGLVALAVALPLFGSPPGGPYLGALDVAGAAAILTAWRGGRARPSALSWPAAGFVAVGLLSLVPSPYLPPSWRLSVLVDLLRVLPGAGGWTSLFTWRAALDLLLGWGLFVAARRAFSGRSPMPLVQGLAAGLVGALLVGLADHAGFLSLDAYRPDYYGSAAVVDRMASVFFLSGWLSEYMVIVGPLAIVGLSAAGWDARWHRPLLLALLITALALTWQRGAWVAAAAQLCFWAAVLLRSGRWDRAQLRRLAVVGGVAVALSAIALVSVDLPPDRLLNRAVSIRSGLEPRVALWRTATEMTLERPLLGWGLGSFVSAYERLHPPGSADAMPSHGSAHSLYLQVAAERGVLGLVALGLLGWAVVNCLRRSEPGRETLALALAVSLIGVAIYGLVQYMYYLRNIAWALWLLTACAALVSRSGATAAVSRAGRVLALVAVLLLPLRGVLAEAPSLPGDREFGFHRSEINSGGAFRWTGERAARRVPWSGETLVLELANGHPRAGQRPITVVVGLAGETQWMTVTGGWEEHRFEVGPPRGEWLLLTLEARPSFRPFNDYQSYPDLPYRADIRELGVAVREPRWE